MFFKVWEVSRQVLVRYFSRNESQQKHVPVDFGLKRLLLLACLLLSTMVSVVIPFLVRQRMVLALKLVAHAKDAYRIFNVSLDKLSGMKEVPLLDQQADASLSESRLILFKHR